MWPARMDSRPCKPSAVPFNGFVPSLKGLVTIHNASGNANNSNDSNAANDSNVPNDPNPPNGRIGFCLRAVHQKFTIVHSPNT